MAGLGSRFLEAGYLKPKYEIIAHERCLFDWAMSSLYNFIKPDSRLIFVCLEQNESARFVLQHSSLLGVKDVHVVELPQLTDGQATSAYLSRDFWNYSEPLLIYNIDTYINPNIISPDNIISGSDGWIPCFRASGDHWSFVQVGDDGWAVNVAEKKRISDLASIGLYWFSKASYFKDAYERFFINDENLVYGERYIAPLYLKLISDGRKISVTDLPVGDIHVLGTPKELNRFLSLSKTDIQFGRF